MEDSQLQYASPLHWGLVSKYRSQLFGFAILWIMCMHSREFTPLLDDAILSQYILYDGIILVGGVGVDIFLFLSGVGLYYAQEKGPTLGQFYARRFQRLLIPYLVIGTAYEALCVLISTFGLTAIISIFIGAVITLQMSINLDSPFIPQSLIGYATRETMILEFSSAVVALILAGKVGSSIASEIGTMRITEQIDALEIMGVNSASYLILPKIVASMIFFPFLTILSILIGVIGGWLIAAATGIMIPADYVDGLLMDFRPYSITYTLIKTVFFAYIITSISAFYGYYARGNSLEVGAASTRAVVASSIVILLFDLILTQVLLI